MSRSGYSEDYWDGDLHPELYRRAVANALAGKRGQKLLKEALAALDAMPVKELIARDFQSSQGFCTLGVVAHNRGVKMDDLDPDSDDTGQIIAKRLHVAPALAREIIYENDEAVFYKESPAERWQRMREWIVEKIKC